MEIISGDDSFSVLDKLEYIFFYFTASWCGPCQRILPDLNVLIEKLKGHPIRFYKIDIDDSDNDEICEKCQVKSVPSFLLFKDRNFLSRVNGADIQGIVQMLTDKCEFIISE